MMVKPWDMEPSLCYVGNRVAVFQNMVSLPASSPSCQKSHLLALPAINGELTRGQSYGLDYGRVFYKRTGLMICHQGLNVGFSGSFGDWIAVSERKKYY